MKLFFFNSLFILVTTFVYSQSKGFVNGYYINRNGSTVTGFVSIDKGISKEFRFKNSPGSNEVLVPFDSCKTISYGNQIFEVRNVSRSMSYVDKFSFDIMNPDSNIVSMLPLKLLWSGKISLYYYHDIKDHFFMDDGDSTQELCVLYRYLTDWEKMQFVDRNMPKYVSDPAYKKQIESALGPKMSKEKWLLIENTEFDQRALIKLFKSLNQNL